MTDVMRFLLVVLITANLFGCAEAYRHPSYEFNSPEDQQNFDKDRQNCALTSDREHCREMTEKTTTICESDGKGGHKCQEIIPKSCTLETMAQCMRRKGWRKADSQGNYLE
jgi:hypothetical protein